MCISSPATDTRQAVGTATHSRRTAGVGVANQRKNATRRMHVFPDDKQFRASCDRLRVHRSSHLILLLQRGFDQQAIDLFDPT